MSGRNLYSRKFFTYMGGDSAGDESWRRRDGAQ